MEVIVFFTGLLTTYGLLGLGLIAFLSVSLLPWPSEPFIILASNYYPLWQVFLVVVIASLASSTLNYWVGLRGFRTWLVKRNKIDEKKAKGWVQKFGAYTLLFSPWIPFIGDLFPIVAGTSKIPFTRFLFYTCIGRLIKTVAVIGFGVTLYSLF